MSEKMMITFVETDDLFFPCIVYSMLIFWQKCKSEICQLEDGKAYLLFVISFTQTGFSKTKFYTPKND